MSFALNRFRNAKFAIELTNIVSAFPNTIIGNIVHTSSLT